MAAAHTSTSGERLEWARRRSRLGLELGPLALLVYLGLRLVTDLLEASPHSGLGLALNIVFGLVALSHVASFVECVATLPAWKYRPVPRPVVLLSVYWLGLLGWLAVGLPLGIT